MSTKSKQSVQRLDHDAIYRAKWTAAAREAYHKEHPENFAGPDSSYPIKDASDVNDAWRLAGHAADPDAVRSKIKAIAKRLGLESGLPDTAKEDSDKSSDRSANPDNTAPDDPLDILADADDKDAHEDEHAIMDTAESIDDEEGDEEECEDGEDMRSQAEADILRTMPADISYYAPITRINKKKREIIGVATAEVKDAYRTVIGYEASKDAFQRWRGNIREMHQNKAVGRALEITPDDAHKRIVVRAMISKGAEDTWQKVLDGTLTGFSIGGKNGVWTKRLVDGEELPYLERYDQAELSVVDNPGCPVANFDIVRADGIASDILAKDDELNPKPSEPTQNTTEVPAGSIDRAGARLSKETQDAMHMARDHAHQAHMQNCQTCGCDECQDHVNALMLIGKNDDNDGDVDANYLAPASMRKLVADIVRNEIAEALRVQLAPTLQRVNALLFNDAQSDEDPEITRRVDDLSSDITAIKDLVEKIADQPVSGGPVLHGGPGVAQDKRLALQSADRAVDDAEILRRALEMGFTPPTTQEAQVLAASKLIRR